MNKDEKAEAVAELTERLSGTETIFAIDYRGISVPQAAELRRRLGDAGASFKVVKNRLAKRAVADAGAEQLDDLFIGPTALTLVDGDAVLAAKAIATFTREHQVLAYKGGIMDGEVLDPDGFAAIARLPGLEVLRGQLTGLAASPITGLARGLGSMLSGLAVALGQIAEQGLVSGEAPAAEPSAEEPEEEAPADEAAPADEPPADEAPADEPPAEEAPAEEPAAEAEETSDETESDDGERGSPEEESSGEQSDD